MIGITDNNYLNIYNMRNWIYFFIQIIFKDTTFNKKIFFFNKNHLKSA